MLLHNCLESVFIVCYLTKSVSYQFKFEPPHGKTNKMTVRPAKTQISLGILQV